MEDFGFKLQNIKYRVWLRKAARIGLMVFAVLISTVLVVKIIKAMGSSNSDRVESVSLVRSQVKNIKRLPEKEGGLVVDNLDVSVYDVIDNGEKEDVNPVVKKTKQNITLKDNTDNEVLLEQELLADKINKINDGESGDSSGIDEVKVVSQEPNKTQKQDELRETLSANIKINNNKKKPTTNVDDLKKLGNNSLIDNLKKKKDVKPGVKVQLLALKSRDSLLEYWNDLKKKYAGLFNDKNYYVEKVTLNKSRVIYRLQVGNFNDKKSALDFCKEYIRLTNKTRSDCIIVKN